MSACDWPVDRGCLPDLPAEDDEDYADKLARRNNAENAAIAVLFALSGRQFMCEEKIARPEPVNWSGICDEAPLIEAYYRNDWRGVSQSKPSPMTVQLDGPVMEILEIRLADEVMDPSEYRVENDILYRLGRRWPRNDMSRPRGFPGTWSVHYIKGRRPPAFVGGYVGELAAEMIAACEGGKCRLPRTVVSTTRSGVTHVFNPIPMLNAGYTGISRIDTWLASVNPHNLASTARIR